MVVTRNSGVSENFRASKKILRDIKSSKSLRPRVSNPNYREESPEEGSYSFFHKIIKVGVSNKKSVSHKLKFQSTNRDKTFKGIHRFQLRTSETNNNGSGGGNQNDNDGKDKSISDFGTNKIVIKSDDSVQMAAGPQALTGDANGNPADCDKAGDSSKLDSSTNNNNERKKYVFTSNMNTRSFKRRISASFSRLPELENSQKCYESPRRYPSRLRRQPTDVYRVNCSFKNDRKSNWQESLSPPLHLSGSKHRKLELHSKQSDTDDSDGLLEDEIRFEKRKQQSIQRARSELNPINMSSSDLKMDLFNDRSIARGSLADIEPMAIDQSITFDMIGGNRKYIQALKESVILPLVYPEVFKKLSINPPRGLLFYGPPGSGKTLLARALVNECNQNNNCKLAFFMRKGADCLSKWVGESERQLRLLFDQAYRMRPSIIFFDEIDGLAPVRSVRQDQIHSSIVSTLLSLIDGLDDRGEIIVIGATNRIDSIDPALRRPGRFDREFMFTLPEEKERMDIIKIHTRDWRPPLSAEMVTKIASVTKGFSGADIKALVVEAGLCALRRRYPQIYDNHNKLQLNLNEIFIKEEDFKVAIKMIRPSNERSGFPLHSPIPKRIGLLLHHDYCVFKEKVANFFPEQVFSLGNSTIESDNNDLLAHHSESSPTAEYSPFFKSRLLVTGFGIEQLISGLFHEIYHVNILSFDSLCLGVNNGFSPEEKLYNIFREADKTPKSIVFLPHIDITFHSMSLSGQNLLLQMVRLHNSNTELSVRTTLILTTLSNSATGTWNDVEFDNVQSSNIWCELGKGFQSSVVKIAPPKFEQRLVYFGELLHLATRPIDSGDQSKRDIDPRDEVLQEVQMTPRTLNKEELEKLEIEEDNVLRKFRMLLRKILASLAKERKFQVFLNPVDVAEVPDYYSIITNPIDLSTMRQKVDLYNYNTFDEFKNDLHLITANALLYNPPTNSYLKDIRRHAYEFNDFAESISEDHWSPQFEKIVNDIHQSRLQRQYYDRIKQATTHQTDDVREFLMDLNGSKLDIANGPLFRTQLQLYAKFYKSNNQGIRSDNEARPHSDNEVVVKKLTTEQRKCKTSKSVSDGECVNCDEESIKTTVQSFKRFQQAASKANKDDSSINEPMDSDREVVDRDPSPQSSATMMPELIKINLSEMNEVIRTAARRTDCSTILQLEELYFLLSKEIFKFSTCTDRTGLSKNLGLIVKDYFHK